MHRIWKNPYVWLCIFLLVMATFTISKTLPFHNQPVIRPNVLLQALVPIETVFNYFGQVITNSSRRFSDWFQFEAELSRLRSENKELRLRQLALDEIIQENLRLRDLLDIKETRTGTDTGFVARVVGRNPGQWFESIVINRGSRDGVAEGMVAINSEGLVGRVISVSNQSAVIRLLTDPNSGVGVTIQRSRDQGVVIGQLANNQTLLIRFFSRDADVETGDIVVSSGRLSQQFPDGMPIGVVSVVSEGEYGLLKQAIVQPYVDFNRLEEVLIIPFQPSLEDEAE